MGLPYGCTVQLVGPDTMFTPYGCYWARNGEVQRKVSYVSEWHCAVGTRTKVSPTSGTTPARSRREACHSMVTPPPRRRRIGN